MLYLAKWWQLFPFCAHFLTRDKGYWEVWEICLPTLTFPDQCLLAIRCSAPTRDTWSLPSGNFPRCKTCSLTRELQKLTTPVSSADGLTHSFLPSSCAHWLARAKALLDSSPWTSGCMQEQVWSFEESEKFFSFLCSFLHLIQQIFVEHLLYAWI